MSARWGAKCSGFSGARQQRLKSPTRLVSSGLASISIEYIGVFPDCFNSALLGGVDLGLCKDLSERTILEHPPQDKEIQG